MKSFLQHIKPTDVDLELEKKLIESNKNTPINPREYPNFESAGLTGPFRNKNGVVYYFQKSDKTYYLPDRDVSVDLIELDDVTS